MNIPYEIFFVLLIIILGGSLGGLISAFISEDLDRSWAFCGRRIVIGLGAAFLVPLFLNMLSSTLLEQAKTTPSAYLIFGGLCIIAAASTKAFISTTSDRLMRQVNEVEEKVRMLRQSIEPILIKEKEPEARLQFVARSETETPVSEPERTILQALNDGAYSMRTLDGIAKETSLDFNFVSSYIGQLQTRGLASNIVGDDDRSFWFLTQLGKMAASLPNT
jgi:hypothetical protein